MAFDVINWLRKCAIRIDATGKTYDADGIRLRFEIKQGTVTPNMATIKLTNMLRSDAEKMCKDQASIGTYVQIDAGYADNIGLLFSGSIVWPIYGRENPTDTLCQLLCTTGNQAMNNAVVNKTFPPGSTPKDHYDEALKSMGQYGVKPGFVGPSVQLSDPRYPRSVTICGDARKVLDDIAHSKGATWSIQNFKLDILKPGDQGYGGAWELNSETGLIGMPTLTPAGVFCRTLINPQMRVNGQVHIDQALIQGYLPGVGPDGKPLPNATPGGVNASIAADGIYRIVKIDVNADTRGEDWYMDLMVIRPGEHTPATNEYDRRTNPGMFDADGNLIGLTPVNPSDSRPTSQAPP